MCFRYVLKDFGISANLNTEHMSVKCAYCAKTLT